MSLPVQPVTAPPHPLGPPPYDPGGALDKSVLAMKSISDGSAGNMLVGEDGITGRHMQAWRDTAKGLSASSDAASYRKSKGETTNLDRPETDVERAQRGAAQIRGVQQIIANVTALLSIPQDLLNAGFAVATNAVAAVFPSLPAAFLGCLYVGMPHGHMHPPSLIPPATVPIPLPSLGMVTLGTCLKVTINGMPAARCGDIGLAPTCVGIVPFFQIKTGSSNVFIGGNRAARLLDICEACSKGDSKEKPASKVGKAAAAAQKGLKISGHVAAGAAVVADLAEAVTEDDAAMASAKGLAAAAGAAQMAADAAAAIVTKTMGTDPGVPAGTKGALTLGSPNVLIGGFPMVNIPNPVDELLGKLKRYKGKKPAEEPADGPGPVSCPIS